MRNRYIRHSICLQGVYSIVREIGFISLEMPLTIKYFKPQKLSTTKACPKISVYAIYILIKLLNSRLSLFLDIFYQPNTKTHLPNKAFHFFFTQLFHYSFILNKGCSDDLILRNAITYSNFWFDEKISILGKEQQDTEHIKAQGKRLERFRNVG